MGEIDFVVHAVAFSDKSELSGEYLGTSRENFLRSMLISCFSFTEVSKEASKIMKEGGSLLTSLMSQLRLFLIIMSWEFVNLHWKLV